MKSLLIGLAATLVLLLGAFWLFQRSFVYPAPPPRFIAIPGYQRVMLQTGDGLDLNAAYRPASSGKSTLIFFHGNGDNLLGAATVVADAVAAGYGALLLEYRGYGGNAGSPSEVGFYADGMAAVDFLLARSIAPDTVVLIGNSIGSGTAVEIASRRKFGGLVLISPFASLPSVVEDIVGGLPVGFLVRDKFDNLSKLPRVQSPVLVMHGERDRVVPFRFGQRLAGSRPGTEFLAFADAGHELAYGREAQQALTRWLTQLPRQARGRPAKSAP